MVLIQFLIGSYYHKMIGLETVQILQLAYFLRIATNQHNTFFLAALNPLKYSAYGGYTDYTLLYGQQTL